MKMQSKYLYTAFVSISVLLLSFGAGSSSAQNEMQYLFNPDVSTELAYSNGYTLKKAVVEDPGREDAVIIFTVDTDANTITNNDPLRRFENIVYDQQGRVSTVGRSNDVVEYNADGTVARLAGGISENYTVEKNYIYEDGKLIHEQRTRLRNDESTTLVEFNYSYDGEGKLVSAQMPDDNSTWDYTLTETGRISEVNVNSETVSGPSRYVFTYDENGNMATYTTYNENGSINEKWTFAYEPNVEAIPNITGFFFAIESGLNRYYI